MKYLIDSMKLAALSDYATRYPILRQGFLSTDIIGAGYVKAELNGKDLYEGQMNLSRVRSNFNIPVAHWGNNSIVSSINYQQTHFETREIRSFSAQFPAADRSITKTAVAFTTTYGRSDSLFNHQINYGGSISGITDELSSVKRVNYSGNISVPLKRDQYSSLTVGMVVIIDPSSVFPVIPFVSYWHKYQNSSLELFVDMPSRIMLRKQMSKKSWAFFGSELGGSLYFFNLNQPAVPQNAAYSSIEIRSGGTFEYLVTPKLILGINGGIYTTASSRVFDRNAQPGDYFFKTTNGSVPYISFSISFLPFLKSVLR